MSDLLAPLLYLFRSLIQGSVYVLCFVGFCYLVAEIRTVMRNRRARKNDLPALSARGIR